MDNEELKTDIIHHLDVIEFLDILGFELSDLVNIPEIEELIEENKAQLQRACR